MGLFQFKAPGAEVQCLLDAVAQLDISEYRLFELAYERWYGTPATAAILQRAFMAYLYTDKVPCWARHYARQVLATQYPSQRVSGSAVSHCGLRQGLLRILGLALLLLFLILMAGNVPEWLSFGQSCYFPPCY